MAGGFKDYLRGLFGWGSSPVAAPTGPHPSWPDPTVVMLVPVMLLMPEDIESGVSPIGGGKPLMWTAIRSPLHWTAEEVELPPMEWTSMAEQLHWTGA